MNGFKANIWFSKTFLAVLAAKIAASFVFSSRFMSGYFAPFVSHFVSNGFHNSWEFFYAGGQTKMFPYPTAMLWLMALPRTIFSFALPADWQAVTPLHLAVMRIPLLLADLLLFFLLLRNFPTQKKAVLYVYWCSPIVFFINYVHGQLDIIPTAVFFLAITLLVEEKYFWASLALAAAMASKTHILLALPFIFVYLYRRRIPLRAVAGYVAVFGAAYAALLFPYFSSEAFRVMVFQAPEQKRFYDFALPVSAALSVPVCPAIYTLILLKFCSYRKLNKEILFMFVGIVFAAMVIFVDPMPGWFLWSMPFLMYFYLGNRDFSRTPFIFYNLVYLAYFLFFFERNGVPGSLPLVNEMALSVLMSTVAFITFWMFQVGVRKNEILKAKEAPLLIGIGGDSGSGKHHLFKVLRNLFGRDACIPVYGDDFHKWERGSENWSVYTHLNPAGNRLHDEMDVAVTLKDGVSVEMGRYDHASGRFTSPVTVRPNKFIFSIGLHPFYLKKMRDSMTVRIFMDTDESLKKRWKLKRDVSLRGHSQAEVLKQMSSRAEDQQKYVEPQKQYADLVVQYLPDEGDAVKVRYRFDNSVDTGNLLSSLRKIPGLKIDTANDTDAQTLEVSGTISSRQVMDIALGLGLNLDELLVRTNRWLKNHDGITQLVFLHVYNFKMEAK